MTIRDLGYKPYEGELLPHSSRYKVLIRRMLALAWGQGLVKTAIFLGAGPMVVCGVIIGVKALAIQELTNRLQQMGANQAQLQAQLQQLPIEDPASYIFFCMYWCQIWFAFTLSLVVAAPAIANDVRTGAFQFYFARPVDRGHYLLGKVVPAALLVAGICGGPALVLTILRLSFAGGAQHWPKLLSTVAFAPILALTLALPPVALSSLSRKPGNIQGLWAALFFASWMLGEGTAAATEVPYAALISIPTDLRLVGQYLFGMQPSYAMPWYLPAGVLAAVIAGSAYVLLRRLARVEVFA